MKDKGNTKTVSLGINRSTLFLLPFVTEEFTPDMELYLGLNTFDDCDGLVYLKLDKTNPIINNFLLKEYQLAEFKSIITTEDSTIICLSLDERYNKDYLNFILGNYKKIKNKRKIVDFWKRYESINELFSVIIYNTFYNITQIKEIYLRELATVDYDKLEKSMDEVGEIHSKIKIEEEILKINL